MYPDLNVLRSFDSESQCCQKPETPPLGLGISPGLKVFYGLVMRPTFAGPEVVLDAYRGLGDREVSISSDCYLAFHHRKCHTVELTEVYTVKS